MNYLLAILLPPIACLVAGRPGAAVLNLLAMLTCIGWPLAMIHAWLIIAESNADRRTEKLARSLRPRRRYRFE